MTPRHRHTTTTTVVAALLAAAVGAVNGERLQGSSVRLLPSPAGPGAAEPNLAVGPDGTVWLSWLEPRAEGGHRFRLAARSGDRWAEPVTIAEGEGFFANWADFPAVFVAANGRMAAHWLARLGSGRYAYGVHLSTSDDGGRTWSAPVLPHRDDSPTEHGFVAFFDAPDGDIGLAWLDGRAMVGSDGGPSDGSMSLRSTTVGRDGLGDDVLVDARVCDCCQTSAARTADGVVLAYRDRSDAEIRDISVSRYDGTEWSAPVPVHADRWRLNACPVNGPVVTAAGDDVAVAWFTGAGEAPETRLAFSTDGGRTFGSAVRLNLAPTLGRLAMVMPGPDRVLVSSLEQGDEGGRIVLREARRDGRLGEPLAIAATSIARASGFPRLALSGSRLTVAWTRVADNGPSSVAVAEIDLAGAGR